MVIFFLPPVIVAFLVGVLLAKTGEPTRVRGYGALAFIALGAVELVLGWDWLMSGCWDETGTCHGIDGVALPFSWYIALPLSVLGLIWALRSAKPAPPGDPEAKRR